LDIRAAYAVDHKFKTYVHNLQTIKPRNANDIVNHLRNPCSFKLPMKKESIDSLSLKSSAWQHFFEECIEVNDDNDCCFLEHLIELLQREDCPSSFASENEMATALNYSFRFVEYITNGGDISRNVSSTTSGSKRPDYFTSANQVPVAQGEDKLLSNFKQGTSGKDPVLGNEEKTPWDVFEYFYGDSELFLGYAAIGGDNFLQLKLGCLVKSSKKFEVFQVLNLFNSDDRVSLLRSWVLLIPVVKGIAECIRQRQKKLSGLVKDTNRRIGNVMVPELTKEVIGIDRTAAFMKTWTFLSAADANIFYNKQRAILDTLSGAENGFLKELPGDSEKLHISTEFDCKVSCVFNFCYPLPAKHTSVSIRFWIRQLCELVSFLHHNNIIHNDIRVLNLLLISEYSDQYPPPQLVLIDYDECVMLTDGFAEGVPLNVKEHAPNISTLHGKEVDIWGIGYVLNIWASTVDVDDGQEVFMTLGQKIIANYKTMSLDAIYNEAAEVPI